MPAGVFDRRVTIKQATEVQDDKSGELTLVWSDLDTVWAELRPLRGQERFTAQQYAAEIDTAWRIRHRTDITPEMRVVDQDGRAHEIKAVLQIGRLEGLELLTTARAE